MTPEHARKYRNTPDGRARAVIDWLAFTVGGSGYTWSDVHTLMTGPRAEGAWKALTLPLRNFTHADRDTVLRGIERRCIIAPGAILPPLIARIHIPTPDAGEAFEGLPR